MKALSKRWILFVATLVCLHSGAGVGDAAIIHVPDQSFVLTVAGESGLVDVGELNLPLSFFASQNAVLNWNWEPAVLNFHQFVQDTSFGAGPSPLRFDAGVEIGGDLSWTFNSRAVRSLASMGEIDSGSFFNAEGYLAVRVYEEEFGWEVEGALPYYGWIQVSHSENDMALTVHDWAWNSVPGEPIQAGQIPEPAAAALLSGVGILFWALARRRSRGARWV